MDLRLELPRRGFRKRRGVGVALEQGRRDHVDTRVSGLRRQDRRHQQFVRRPVVQLGIRARVLCLESIEDLARLVRCFHRCQVRLKADTTYEHRRSTDD
jgi:hypothetical protein